MLGVPPCGVLTLTLIDGLGGVRTVIRDGSLSSVMTGIGLMGLRRLMLELGEGSEGIVGGEV